MSWRQIGKKLSARVSTVRRVYVRTQTTPKCRNSPYPVAKIGKGYFWERAWCRFQPRSGKRCPHWEGIR